MLFGLSKHKISVIALWAVTGLTSVYEFKSAFLLLFTLSLFATLRSLNFFKRGAWKGSNGAVHYIRENWEDWEESFPSLVNKAVYHIPVGFLFCFAGWYMAMDRVIRHDFYMLAFFQLIPTVSYCLGIYFFKKMSGRHYLIMTNFFIPTLMLSGLVGQIAYLYYTGHQNLLSNSNHLWIPLGGYFVCHLPKRSHSIILGTLYLIISAGVFSLIDYDLFIKDSIRTIFNGALLGTLLNSIMHNNLQQSFYGQALALDARSKEEASHSAMIKIGINADSELWIKDIKATPATIEIFGELSSHSFNEYILEKLNLKDNELKSIRSVLKHSINKDPIYFELNSDNLLSESIIQQNGKTKHLTLKWSASLKARNGSVHYILLTVDDVTALKFSERSREEMTIRATIWEEMCRMGPIDSVSFVESGKKSVSKLKFFDIDQLETDQLKRIRRILHDLKGEASMFGLGRIAEECHELETYVQEHKKNSAALIEGIEKLEGTFKLYSEIIVKDLHWTDFETKKYDADNIFYMIENIPNLLEDLKAGKLNPGPFFKAMRTSYHSHHEIVGKLIDRCGPIADELGKHQPHVVLDGEPFYFKRSIQKALSDSFIHLLNNSLDHGIERPDIRLSKGKSICGKIHISSNRFGEFIEIRWSDDGASINFDAIRLKARTLGIDTNEMTNEELCQLIFQHGFSTKTNVTQISGRGIGLDSVRERLSGLGCSITPSLAPGGKLSFTISIPLCYLLEIGDIANFEDHQKKAAVSAG